MSIATPIPNAPRAIQKGTPLKFLIDQPAINALAANIHGVKANFAVSDFCHACLQGLDSLSLMARAKHVALQLRKFLPENYSTAVTLLVNTLPPEQPFSEQFGLEELFYLPHSCFISAFGLSKKYNNGQDPFDISMWAMYELTKRFTAEYAIRDFIIEQQGRTFMQLNRWLDDENPRVRRLCSEGTRPKLPWGKRLTSLVENPKPTLDFLETLKNDPTLYVRRSVANHLGDIGKDHPELVFSICEQWLAQNASKELKWLIRHAVRYLAKKGHQQALKIRALATP